MVHPSFRHCNWGILRQLGHREYSTSVFKISFRSHSLQQAKPGPFVKDIKEEAEFYGNRLIKEYKDKCVRRGSTFLVIDNPF